VPSLAKLLDCLKWPRGRGSSQPVGPIFGVHPVADPEVAFGWQGYLFSNATLVGPQAANTVIASVTIPDDCFYCIDFVYNIQPQTAQSIRDIKLQILDVAGVVAWEQRFAAIISQITAVGITMSSPVAIPTLRLHLQSGMIVRVTTIAAMVSGDIVLGSIALRKLYEENL